MSVLSPDTLHSILRNISLCLPENYELIAGARFESIYLYYQLIGVTTVGGAHGIILIFEVPLKNGEPEFYFVSNNRIARTSVK